jgi:thiamine-monophosphate kinase
VANEFALISRYFKRAPRRARLGVGDDCALLDVPTGQSLAISTDMLVAGQHFFPGTDPYRLGRKSLAVNLSDLAACAALPRHALLSLALPEANEAWLAAFSEGFWSLADAWDVELIGGDTTRGPLTISVTIMGEVDARHALRRDAARDGDVLWLSGCTGEAALGLACLQDSHPGSEMSGALSAVLTDEQRRQCLKRLEDPTPRVLLGQNLRGVANSAIDISDGLLADLGHVLQASGLRADIELSQLPCAPALKQVNDQALQRRCLLSGGDDYELLFTASLSMTGRIQDIADALQLPLTRIGTLHKAVGDQIGLIRLHEADGSLFHPQHHGFDHFAVASDQGGERE